MARYWAYIAPPSTATVLPSSACAAGDAPAATTVPAPFVAHRQGLAHPGGHAFIARSGTCAVTTGAPACPRPGGGHIGRTEQQADVRRVDGRGLDAHDDVVGGRGHGVSSVFEIHSSTGPAPARPAASARQCRYA
jgi:hypothetical protein